MQDERADGYSQLSDAVDNISGGYSDSRFEALRPRTRPTSEQYTPPPLYYPQVAMPSSHSTFSVGNLTASPVGMLLSALLNNTLPNLLGVRGGFQMPVFGRSNPMMAIADQARYGQLSRIMTYGIEQNVQSWQRTIGLIPSIGSGRFDGKPSDEAMRIARLPAELITNLGPMLEPLLNAVGVSYKDLVPGGDAHMGHIHAWRAGRLSYRGGGMFGMPSDRQKKFHENLQQLVAPDGDFIKGLGFTGGLDVEQVGGIMENLSIRGLAPGLMDARMEDNKGRMSYQYKKSLENWNKTIASLTDIFSGQDVSKIFQNLDRLTAGEAVNIGPAAARQMAQKIKAIALQTGVSEQQIVQAGMMTASRAKSMGLSGAAGANVGMESLATARLVRGLTGSGLGIPGEGVIRQGLIDSSLNAQGSYNTRRMGALIQYYSRGLDVGMSEEARGIMETITSEKASVVNKTRAFLRLQNIAGKEVESVMAKNPGFGRLLEDPGSATFAVSQVGFTEASQQSMMNDMAGDLTRELSRRFKGDEKGPEKLSEIMKAIHSYDPSRHNMTLASYIGSELNIKDNKFISQEEMMDVSNILRDVGRGYNEEYTPEVVAAMMKARKVMDVTSRLQNSLNITEEALGDSIGERRAGIITRLHSAISEVLDSGVDPAIARNALGSVLSKMTRYTPTLEEINELPESMRAPFIARLYQQQWGDLERVEKFLGKDYLVEEDRGDLEVRKKDLEEEISTLKSGMGGVERPGVSPRKRRERLGEAEAELKSVEEMLGKPTKSEKLGEEKKVLGQRVKQLKAEIKTHEDKVPIKLVEELESTESRIKEVDDELAKPVTTQETLDKAQELRNKTIEDLLRAQQEIIVPDSEHEKRNLGRSRRVLDVLDDLDMKLASSETSEEEKARLKKVRSEALGRITKLVEDGHIRLSSEEELKKVIESYDSGDDPFTTTVLAHMDAQEGRSGLIGGIIDNASRLGKIVGVRSLETEDTRSTPATEASASTDSPRPGKPGGQDVVIRGIHNEAAAMVAKAVAEAMAASPQ